MTGLRIDDCKAELNKPVFLALLANSVYDPTPERLSARAASYMAGSDVLVYGAWQDTVPIGIAVLRNAPQETELLSIAVAAPARGTGVGHRLIAHVRDALPTRRILAETDDDAVGFYRACGFQVESLGEKYPGVVRYRCVLDCE